MLCWGVDRAWGTALKNALKQQLYFFKIVHQWMMKLLLIVMIRLHLPINLGCSTHVLILTYTRSETIRFVSKQMIDWLIVVKEKREKQVKLPCPLISLFNLAVPLWRFSGLAIDPSSNSYNIFFDETIIDSTVLALQTLVLVMDVLDILPAIDRSGHLFDSFRLLWPLHAWCFFLDFALQLLMMLWDPSFSSTSSPHLFNHPAIERKRPQESISSGEDGNKWLCL